MTLSSTSEQFGRAAVVAAICTITMLATVSPVEASPPGEPTRVNRDLAANETAYVSELSPDGSFIVYLVGIWQQALSTTPLEIRRVAIDGSSDVRLSQPEFSRSGAWWITPDASRVLLIEDLDDDGISELVSLPSSGGSPITLLEHDTVKEIALNRKKFDFTADGRYVIFTSDLRIDGRSEVFRIPTSGGAATRISHDEGMPAYHNALSPRGDTVVYAVDGILYIVPIGGGVPVPLSGGLTGAWYAQFTPDGQRVLFMANDSNDTRNLYVTPRTGGTPTELASAVHNKPYVVAPDGESVGYFVQESTSRYEFWVASVSGDGAFRITPQSVNIRSDQWDRTYMRFTADGQRVVFLSAGSIYSVPSTGGDLTQLNSPNTDAGNAFATSSTDNWVAYAETANGGAYEVFAVRADGNQRRQISDPEVLESGRSFSTRWMSPTFSQDGTRVLYGTDKNDHNHIFSVATTGGPVERINRPGQGKVALRGLVPDSHTAMFHASPGHTGSATDHYVKNLYVVDIATPICLLVTPTIEGGPGPDVLQGTDGDDIIFGYGGDDDIRGNGGNDVICGGDGDDTLIGGSGDDTLYGEAGADLIKGQLGNDIAYGGSGDDRIQDGPGDDTLAGDDGRDKLWGGIGTDALNGGAGNDQLHGGRDDDQLAGADGTDRLWGDSGDDTINGGANADFLYGGIGLDVLSGGVGNDRLFGWTGNDSLFGQAGRDQLRGQYGEDYVNGGTQADFCAVETVWLNCEIEI